MDSVNSVNSVNSFFLKVYNTPQNTIISVTYDNWKKYTSTKASKK
jgi:hypothetical protein